MSAAPDRMPAGPPPPNALLGPRRPDRAGEIMASLCRAATVLVTCALVLILGHIAIRGSAVVSWEFLTEAPTEGMTEGGILPAIFGTVAITLLMILLALPLGTLAGIYLVEYAGAHPVARVIRAAVNNLAGVHRSSSGSSGSGSSSSSSGGTWIRR